MSTVSVKGLSKAAVLAALYNAAAPQGLGFLHYRPEPMTEAQAEEVIQERQRGSFDLNPRVSFDYLAGRAMKVGWGAQDEDVDVFGYDRNNGAGTAARVIAALRAEGASPEALPEAQAAHREGVVEAAARVRVEMARPDRSFQQDGVECHQLGLQGVAERLEPHVAEAEAEAAARA